MPHSIQEEPLQSGVPGHIFRCRPPRRRSPAGKECQHRVPGSRESRAPAKWFREYLGTCACCKRQFGSESMLCSLLSLEYQTYQLSRAFCEWPMPPLLQRHPSALIQIKCHVILKTRCHSIVSNREVHFIIDPERPVIK